MAMKQTSWVTSVSTLLMCIMHSSTQEPQKSKVSTYATLLLSKSLRKSSLPYPVLPHVYWITNIRCTSIYTGAIKKNIQLTHFTKDEQYLALLRQWDCRIQQNLYFGHLLRGNLSLGNTSPGSEKWNCPYDCSVVFPPTQGMPSLRGHFAVTTKGFPVMEVPLVDLKDKDFENRCTQFLIEAFWNKIYNCTIWCSA